MEWPVWELGEDLPHCSILKVFCMQFKTKLHECTAWRWAQEFKGSYLLWHPFISLWLFSRHFLAPQIHPIHWSSPPQSHLCFLSRKGHCRFPALPCTSSYWDIRGQRTRVYGMVRRNTSHSLSAMVSWSVRLPLPVPPTPNVMGLPGDWVGREGKTKPKQNQGTLLFSLTRRNPLSYLFLGPEREGYHCYHF